MCLSRLFGSASAYKIISDFDFNLSLCVAVQVYALNSNTYWNETKITSLKSLVKHWTWYFWFVYICFNFSHSFHFTNSLCSNKCRKKPIAVSHSAFNQMYWQHIKAVFQFEIVNLNLIISTFLFFYFLATLDASLNVWEQSVEGSLSLGLSLPLFHSFQSECTQQYILKLDHKFSHWSVHYIFTHYILSTWH